MEVAWVRGEDHVEDRVGYAGRSPNRLFVVVHAPREAPATAALVVCAPILADVPADYRREVLLGRALAALGVAVVRFHYRGWGNSEGDASLTTFEALVADADVATAAAPAGVPPGRLAFLGTRVGALVAAAAARRHPAARLVVCEPVDGADYWREAERARRVRGMTGSGDGTAASADAELDRTGWFDLLGYRVDRALYESVRTRTLATELGPGPRPVLRLDGPESRRRWWFSSEAAAGDVGSAAGQVSAWLASEPQR
jgi:alpha/beta superfamily hydrolase